MKKCTLVTLVMAFLLVMASSYGLAQVTGRADTSKEGSLLIWPLVQTDGFNETYIILVNSSASEVNVKCYWEIKDVRSNPMSECFLSDFAIVLTGFNPVVFKASDGSGLDGRGVAGGMGTSEKGVLKCWAVDETQRKQISWNHLSGSALIVNADSTLRTSVWQYNAWRFAANVINSTGYFVDGFWVGQVADVGGAYTNAMNLKGTPTTVVSPANCPPPYDADTCSLPNAVYDGCPRYLTFDFLAEPSSAIARDGYAFNNLALIPCKEDLTGPSYNLKTKVTYTIWNENEVKYTGLYQCANCDYESALGNLNVGRSTKTFRMKNLHTSSGRFRVEGLFSSKCGADSVATPFVGVMSSQLVDSTDLVGTNGSASGLANTDYGYIWYEPTGAYYQKPRH